MNKCLNVDYDVALSFAGEERAYVEDTAKILIRSGIKVFYDKYEDVALWGKDLYQHLDNIYQNKAKYVIIFISKNYADKLWTSHELKSAQARAFLVNEEYILPARFDDTELPGIRKTIGYLDLRKLSPSELSEKIIKKLKTLEPAEFLPNKLTYVKQVIDEIYEDFDKDSLAEDVNYVFEKLKKTNSRERNFLALFNLHSCHHDITKDLHEDLTLIERVTGYSRQEIIDILNGLKNLGFEYKISKKKTGSAKLSNESFYESLSLKLISRLPDLNLTNLTPILAIMYSGAIWGACEECALKVLNRLDFSNLKHKVHPDELHFLIPLDL